MVVRPRPATVISSTRKPARAVACITWVMAVWVVRWMMPEDQTTAPPTTKVVTAMPAADSFCSGVKLRRGNGMRRRSLPLGLVSGRPSPRTSRFSVAAVRRGRDRRGMGTVSAVVDGLMRSSGLMMMSLSLIRHTPLVRPSSAPVRGS
ncbi:MAG: hypothetical protein FD119_1462 [Stygiobacter sp.]|nr:MAG: hypothetical protein FD119_1462 [Stygiobacter sp.]